ncbi:MAG: hypothetical protein LKI67_01980 [Olsenella sp.]|nr:hypothetical protein [Olsenella sp.]MCI1810607.1 hypothetical protein [Olsenella sp.]MCI1879310.1 hypothetical protein [Olsenella sp.]
MQPSKTTAGVLQTYFRFQERGARLSDEIWSGLGMCVLSVVGMFINMQLIAQLSISGSYGESTQAQIAANGETYASIWFFTMLIAFAATLAMGLIAKLPVAQASSLGFSSVLISLIGTATGLTYANVLVLCMFGSLAYVLLVSIPAVRGFLKAGVPDSVRSALPAAAGLLVAFVAVQLSGFVTVQGSGIVAYGPGTILPNISSNVSLFSIVGWGSFGSATDKYNPQLLLNAIAMVIVLVTFLVAKRRSRHPFTMALLVGTVFFLVACVLLVCINWKNFKFSLDSLWARLWMVGAEDAVQYHLGAILASFSFGKVISEGMDFSGFVSGGGNVILLALGSVVTFATMALADAVATTEVVCASAVALDARRPEMQKALVVNAATNVVAPFFGVSPIALDKSSYAGSEDRGRTGFSAVVCAIGFLVSAFVWVIPFFFSTVNSYDITFNMVGHYGFVMQLLCQCGFSVADMMMVLVGLNMALRSLSQNWRKFSVSAAFVATVAGTLFTTNIAVGTACGIVSYVTAEASRKRQAVIKMGEEADVVKRIGMPTLILCAVSIVVIAFGLLA